MKLISLAGNSQRLDGGAMFGNAPKALWSRWVEVAEDNSIDLATRGLLAIFDDGLKVLFETGIGAFFSPELSARYGVVERRHVLLDSLAEHGLSDVDIDAVVLSHLHFDHAGGLLASWREGEANRLLFPNARFFVSQEHWRRATQPHPRDNASFIPDLCQLLESSGRLQLVDSLETQLLDGKIKLHFSDGHTPGLMLAELSDEQGPVVFSSDLIPAAPWVHLPMSMGYDRFPELVINEKQSLLEDLLSRQGRLFFTHDPNMICGSVVRDGKGRYSVKSVSL